MARGCAKASDPGPHNKPVQTKSVHTAEYNSNSISQLSGSWVALLLPPPVSPPSFVLNHSNEPAGGARTFVWNPFGRSRIVSHPTSTTTALLFFSIMDPTDPVQLPMNTQEVDPFFHDDENSLSDDSTVSSSSPHIQPPATSDIALTAPSPDRTVPPSPALPPPSATAPAPDSDDDEEEMPDLYIPALIAPTMFLPIPNVRLSYFFKPVSTW